jgi:predicted DNA-binding transcriptional regulator AlpA
MPKASVLPIGYVLRLLNREQAAEYVNASPSLFDQMVDDGRMPQPRVLSEGRLAWDVRELDIAVDRLPHRGEEVAAPGGEDHTWDKRDANREAKAKKLAAQR